MPRLKITTRKMIDGEMIEDIFFDDEITEEHAASIAERFKKSADRQKEAIARMQERNKDFLEELKRLKK